MRKNSLQKARKTGRNKAIQMFITCFYYHEGHEDNEEKKFNSHNIAHEINTGISSSPSW
jgi:hypothetical protein